MVESFVASGSRLAAWSIKSVELSWFAWDIDCLQAIEGETGMGRTAFVAEIRDRRMFSMGATFDFEFFDPPKDYTPKDIKTIHSGMIYSESGGLKPCSLDLMQPFAVFREKPYFTCYLDEPDA